MRNECENGNRGKPLSGSVRVDPWECYQDTWQTTCSVLEHHRDLMKVSWATAGGRVPPKPGRPGKSAAGLQTWFGVRLLGQRWETRSPSRKESSQLRSRTRACPPPCPPAQSDRGWFSTSDSKPRVGVRTDFRKWGGKETWPGRWGTEEHGGERGDEHPGAPPPSIMDLPVPSLQHWVLWPRPPHRCHTLSLCSLSLVLS